MELFINLKHGDNLHVRREACIPFIRFSVLCYYLLGCIKYVYFSIHLVFSQ